MADSDHNYAGPSSDADVRLNEQMGSASTMDDDSTVADSLDSLLGVGMVDQDALERDIIAKVI